MGQHRASTSNSSKRKKHHDKDKYYNLAKEQGFRSRAAFKLSQINRKFPMLQEARVILDLCAAPGGWTQVAARTIPKTQDAHIVAVDILPIRNFGNAFSNLITTLVGDITTAKCKADITNTLRRKVSSSNSNSNNNSTVDLVLHDGAPNIGASYEKDAYEQNEIAVHALKCATQHLKRNGHFVTKVYRSRDYSSFLWVCQQFFRTVTAFKPKASRAQSAEIFLVCQHYLAPDKIDPKMLDPKHIFEHVQGDSSAPTAEEGGGIHVFHKAWDQKRRHREGYDMTNLDASMRRVEPVANFLQAKGMKEAIQVLSQCTGFTFTCEECTNKRQDHGDNHQDVQSTANCHCQFYLKHPLTTPETKSCVSDLKVLNKGDFKGLLSWRDKMHEALKAMKESRKGSSKDADKEDASSDDDGSGDDKEAGMASDEEEAQIQSEIEGLRQKRLREKKRIKKKERTQAAKRRARAALGMDLNAIDVPEHDKTFTLATITSKGELEAVAEVDLDQVTDEQIFGNGSDDDDIMVDLDDAKNDDSDDDSDDKEVDENTGYKYRLDRELDEAYDRYLETTKDGLAKAGTKMAKRKKKSRRINALEEEEEDAAILESAENVVGNDAKAYARLLQGAKDSDDDDSSEEEAGDVDDDGFDADPMTPEEHAAAKDRKQTVEGNPLIHKLAEEPSSVKTARWFSNPLFASIGQTAESATAPKKRRAEEMDDADESDDDAGSQSDGSEDESLEDAAAGKTKKRTNGKSEKKKVGLSAEEVINSMPKTDKQKRHEKRLKAMEREERKKARKARKMGEAEAAFEVAPGEDASDEEEDDKLEHLSADQKKKVLEARELIKAGMGAAVGADQDSNRRIEIVAEGDRPLPAIDTRKYDSDHEGYDSDDLAQTLALGTMMLRHSKAKAMVDASYNRYAWNDPEGLPDWFVDDEAKHYRPVLPIPPALIAKIKQEQMMLSQKPIAKVAEARARKSKRAKLKLAAAKKKAEAVANSSEMSEAMKLKAISKALRQQDTKKPGKSYVVAKKGRGNVGAKGVKLVDKRLKNDKRSMDRKDKKRKKGKQNGLVGSKKRRNHR